MVKRLSVDARRMLLTSAAEEARRRGDRRLGTDHLLLGILHDQDSPAARALGIDLESARVAADALDRAALSTVGIEVGQPGPTAGTVLPVDCPRSPRERGRFSKAPSKRPAPPRLAASRHTIFARPSEPQASRPRCPAA